MDLLFNDLLQEVALAQDQAGCGRIIIRPRTFVAEQLPGLIRGCRLQRLPDGTGHRLIIHIAGKGDQPPLVLGEAVAKGAAGCAGSNGTSRVLNLDGGRIRAADVAGTVLSSDKVGHARRGYGGHGDGTAIGVGTRAGHGHLGVAARAAPGIVERGRLDAAPIGDRGGDGDCIANTGTGGSRHVRNRRPLGIRPPPDSELAEAGETREGHRAVDGRSPRPDGRPLAAAVAFPPEQFQVPRCALLTGVKGARTQVEGQIHREGPAAGVGDGPVAIGDQGDIGRQGAAGIGIEGGHLDGIGAGLTGEVQGHISAGEGHLTGASNIPGDLPQPAALLVERPDFRRAQGAVVDANVVNYPMKLIPTTYTFPNRYFTFIKSTSTSKSN